MGLLRELCVSLAACLLLLPVVWPVSNERSTLLARAGATSTAADRPHASSPSQPTELAVIAPSEELTLKPGDFQATNAALLTAVKSGAPEDVTLATPRKRANPLVLAATDATASELEETQAELNAQPRDLSVVAPIEDEILRPKGHQVSDATLLAAVEWKTAKDVTQAALLDPPEPTLFANINLTTQRLTVSTKTGVLHTWKISSARRGYVTPVGTYKPQWTSRMHYSKQYYNSPMPYSVFFHRGYAVHGTSAVGRLGRPASHGCVRLRTSNAKTFYNLVHKHGKGLTKIAVRGTPPASRRVRDARPRRRYRARKRVRRPSYQSFGLFSAYSYRQPRRSRYRRRRYSNY